MAQGQTETAPTAEERAAWHALAMRLVRQYPDGALRSAANAVADVDDDLRRLIERMGEIMTRSHGVGLAGPQVGVLRRVLVYRRDDDEVRALVNPVLLERSDERTTDTEGCLSLLGGELVVPVERHARVRVGALDHRGEPVDLEVEGFEARVVQHEIDHLDGVLIIDRTEPEERKRALRELRLRAAG